MNSVVLSGHLTGPAKVSNYQDERRGQVPVAVFTVAVGRSCGPEADLIPVTAYGRDAELCVREGRRGRYVLVRGALRQTSWRGDRSHISVHADIVEFDGPARGAVAANGAARRDAAASQAA